MSDTRESMDSGKQIEVLLYDAGTSSIDLVPPLEGAVGITVANARSADECLEHVDGGSIDCLVCVVEGNRDVLSEVRDRRAEVPCLLVGELPELHVEATDAGGVTDYLPADLLLENDAVLANRVREVVDLTEPETRRGSLIENTIAVESIVEVIETPSFVVDERRRVTSVNSEFERQFDLSETVLLDEPVGELWKYGPFDSDDATTINDSLQIVQETNSSKTDAVELSDVDGGRHYRNCTVTPLVTRCGAIRTICTLDDGFDREAFDERLDKVQRANEMLLEADDKMTVCSIAAHTTSRLLDMPFGGAWLYDDEHNHLQPVAGTAEAHEELGGIPFIRAGEGLAWDVFVDGEPAVFEDVSANEGLYNPNTIVESEIILPMGDIGLLTVGSKTQRTFTHEDVRLITLHSQNIESALVRTEREEELSMCNERLERQNDRLSDFARIVSHDLRNPMNVANGHLPLAREGNTEAVDTIEESLKRMNEIIEDILDLSRKGQLVTDPSDVSMEHVVKTAWERVSTDESTLRTGRLPVVKADSVRVVRLMENLFENAIEHAGPDVTVTVSEFDWCTDSVTTTLPEPTGIYVADDGSGFPDEADDRLFESGFTTMSDGPGLGLAVVREIAEAHGWDVRATESRDGGARIEIVGLTPVDPCHD